MKQKYYFALLLLAAISVYPVCCKAKALRTDVLVVGGGTAGVPAAIQAARLGCDVTLVEAGGQLGGTMTTGGVSFPGLFHAHGGQIISGIGWEIVCETVQMDGGTLPDFSIPYGKNHSRHQIRINAPLYAALAEEKCMQCGIHIRYYEFPVRIVKRTGGWRVTLAGKGTKKTILCKQIIDATGNASVISLAGYARVREDNCQPGSLIFQLEGYEFDKLDMPLLDSLFKQARADSLISLDNCYLSLRSLLNINKGLAVSHVPGADSSTSEAHTTANIAGREGLLRLVRVLKTFPGLENLTVKSAQSEVAVRESWRIVGEQQITIDDYLSGRRYDDAVCYSFYPIDLHDAEGVKPRQLKSGVVPTVPLGALIPKGSRNIIVAGRCISSDRLANSALRVQASCMAMGQAAGAAAALAVFHKCTPGRVPYSDLCAILREHGAIIPAIDQPE